MAYFALDKQWPNFMKFRPTAILLLTQIDLSQCKKELVKWLDEDLTPFWACRYSALVNLNSTIIRHEWDEVIQKVKEAMNDSNLFVNISTNIIEGRVLLTGLVDNQEIRIDAVRRVWEVDGVNEVINEIQIGDRSTLKEYANDVWINTQAKGKAATVVGLKVVGYNFETIQGKVYIAGITTKPEQLDELVESIKTIKGVKEIINYVIVK